MERLLSNDDQLFIYELAGNLIVNSHFTPEKKASLMTALLRPLVQNFQPALLEMKTLVAKETNSETSQDQKIGNKTEKSEVYAVALNYMMSYAR